MDSWRIPSASAPGDSIRFLVGRQTVPNTQKQDGACHDGEKAHHLRIGQTVKHSWIDANELNKKTRNPSPDQVATDYFTSGTHAVRRFRRHAPQKCGDDYSGEKLVDRRGVNPVCRPHDAIWKAHTPRQICGYAIVAVSG